MTEGQAAEAADCIYCAHAATTSRRTQPIHCARCNRHIGKGRTVCLMDRDGVMWCMRCRIGDGTSAWWEAHHPLACGTQAGVRACSATSPSPNPSDTGRGVGRDVTADPKRRPRLFRRIFTGRRMRLGGLVGDCECGRVIVQPARGRRRSRCEVCSPRRSQKKTSVPEAVGEDHPVVAAVKAELAAVGRLGTADGALAVHGAGLLVAGEHTGASAAALMKELAARLAAATEGAATGVDLVDELRAVRERRRA